MKKGFKYRIYPNKEQRTLLEQHFGSVRFIYNRSLFIKNTMYSKFKINVSEIDLNNNLISLKEFHPWLKDLNSQSLQQANRNLLTGFKNFFEGNGSYPTRKNKRDNDFSFQVPQNYQINLTTSKIYLPKIGWIKIVLHRDFVDKEFIKNKLVIKEVNDELIIDQKLNKEFDILKTLTVSRTSAGRYHVSILIDDHVPEPTPVEFDESTTVGIDVGIKSFAILSSGEVIDNPRFLKKSLNKLKKLQRAVSKKKVGSKNRKKAVAKVAKQHQLVANQRNDFQHKVSIKIISESQAICLEDLNVSGMIKNHKLAQAISDVGWSEFIRKLTYKAEWYGKTILRIGRFDASSKLCNVCGYKKDDLTLDIREWECPSCKTFHYRDVNAAINIKNIALNNLNTVGTTERACGLTGIGQRNEARSYSVFS
ncbi:RNA-guided endonuclease TnpB family protein [Methanolobus vulcani]|uniref:IS200/IS605 family element transposase accessory protein TnpB n=1 Tax=Methanolobus vulcani TaxID=38026 RepID=A0A7Z8P447_9EURY|nr:RNA-guided endonuclease TnpB family protein [Methanolobus vulcani]TQD23411.1 IS200/IS605 family element transposase accessory protein TnpB [Methanolobus vulcani]